MNPASDEPAEDVDQHASGSPARNWLRFIWPVVLLGLLVLANRGCQNARRDARKNICKNNLKFIGLSLQNYKDVYGSLPPVHLVDSNGSPTHSWRTILSPYYFYDLQTDYFAQLDLSKPWDDPVNATVLDRHVGTIQCSELEGDPSSGITHYVAVVGENSPWPKPITGEELPEPLSEEQRKANSKEKLAERESNTKDDSRLAKILVVDWPESDIQWREPRDLSVDQFLHWFQAQSDKRSIHPGNSILYLGDDFEVHELPLDTSLEEVRILLDASAD